MYSHFAMLARPPFLPVPVFIPVYTPKLALTSHRKCGPTSPVKPHEFSICLLEATTGFEPVIRVLQTLALTTWPRRRNYRDCGPFSWRGFGPDPCPSSRYSGKGPGLEGTTNEQGSSRGESNYERTTPGTYQLRWIVAVHAAGTMTYPPHMARPGRSLVLFGGAPSASSIGDVLYPLASTVKAAPVGGL